MAIKMNATNFQTNKEFRQNVDIRKKIKQGIKKRAIYLPPEDFAYGVPNRPSTPMKNVVNNEYGNVAEEEIKKDYQTFITEKIEEELVHQKLFLDLLILKFLN